MRNTVLLAFVLVGMVGVLSAGVADQTLTITLDPPQAESQKEQSADLRLNHETLGATREGAAKQPGAQAQASDGSAKKEVVIGRVGIVIASKAAIKSVPGKKGRTLYTCPKDTYLAIASENGSWYGVLMIDSSTGWIEKGEVRLLDYRVVAQSSQSDTEGTRIVNTALKYLGIPYKWGGYSFSGLDCSGFVRAVFASNGLNLPRVSRDQALVGTPIGWNQLRPGDRLYFACKGGQIDHAGIYTGNGLFIHSSASRGGVAVDNVLDSFYVTSLVAARRN